MTDVVVPYGDSAAETATLLLAAAEKAGEDASVVRTGSYGSFYAPEKLAKDAGVKYTKGDVDSPEVQEIVAADDAMAQANEPHGAPDATKSPDEVEAEAKKAPAKKTAAKKAPAKKTAAKKTAAKKTAKKG